LEATTKKTPAIRKMPRRRWLARMHRLMSNRKQILRAKCVGEALLLWPVLYPLRRQRPVISSKKSLECIRARRPRLRHRHLTAGVEHHHDEHPTRTIAAVHLVSSASDRTTYFVL
jgi:hypothetical protein